jgi:serine/threonine protein kinase
MPFTGANDQAIYNKIELCDFSFPDHSTATAEAQDFICKLLTLDVASRMTAEEALNHPWLHGIAPVDGDPDVHHSTSTSCAIM